MASKELLASKVVFIEAGQAIPENYESPTAIAAAVMVTERGPIGEAVRAGSWGEWQKIFGGYTSSSHGPETVANFFAMGGRVFWTVRTVHYTDTSDPDTATAVKASQAIPSVSAVAQPGVVSTSVAAPYLLAAGDTILIKVDGGGASTATISATAGISTAGSNETYNLTGGETLTLKIDGGAEQTITVNVGDITSGAATKEQVAALINKEIVGGRAIPAASAVAIYSDTLGTDSSVQITGGTANSGILDFDTAVHSGTGNVADVTGVTIAELKAIIEGAVGGVEVTDLGAGLFKIATTATGSTHSIQIDAASTADTKLGLDNTVHTGSDAGTATTLTANGKTEGSYANALYVEIAAATNGDSDYFNLNIKNADVTLEYHTNLSMSASDDRYAVTVLSEDSDLLALVDAGTGDRPTNGTYGPLSGGDDGLSGIVDADYIGDSGGRTGLYALDAVSIINLIAVPGVTSAAVQNALINYALIQRGGIPVAIVAPPEGSNATEAVSHVESAGILELADCSACYWPWVKVVNPSTTVYGTSSTITVPPEGVVMGRAALTDVSKPGGVYQSPAGLLYGVANIVLGIDSEQANEMGWRDYVYPKRINPIHKDEGTPYYIDGSYTLKNSDYPTLGERRGRSKIELDLTARYNALRHLPATKETRKTLERVTTTYLNDQMRVGAFASKVPEEAYAIDAGDGINPATEEEKGILNVDINVRMAGSYQWVKVKFSNRFGLATA